MFTSTVYTQIIQQLIYLCNRILQIYKFFLQIMTNPNGEKRARVQSEQGSQDEDKCVLI